MPSSVYSGSNNIILGFNVGGTDTNVIVTPISSTQGHVRLSTSVSVTLQLKMYGIKL